MGADAVAGGGLRTRIVVIYALLIGLNVAAWAIAFLSFSAMPGLLALCGLAYGLGLRHAVDADHIAAIDNVTRKLMQEGKRPVAVGFFFSLGHSTIVIIMSGLVALGTGFLHESFPQVKEIGAIIGTSVSAFFLLLIAAMNFVIFLRIWQEYRGLKSGGSNEQDLEDYLNSRGFLPRVLRPVFRIVSKSWHMYPVGLLFGLGFDTASEVALYGIAASQQQIPLWSILIFPLLFTAGMCLIDTTDGIVMLGAYGWAFLDPGRKLFYNMTITLISFLTAFLVGSLEVMSIVADKLELKEGIWSSVSLLSEHSEVLGFAIIGLLLVSWLIAVAVWSARQ